MVPVLLFGLGWVGWQVLKSLLCRSANDLAMKIPRSISTSPGPRQNSHVKETPRQRRKKGSNRPGPQSLGMVVVAKQTESVWEGKNGSRDKRGGTITRCVLPFHYEE